MSEVVLVSPTVNKKPSSLIGENKHPQTPVKCQVALGSLKCSVNNCPTNSVSDSEKSHITFVTIPKDPSRFTEWIRAIDRPDLLSYLGKKAATNLLVCSKHFSIDMWVNSNTRLKKLHKNAVPEKVCDEIDIVAVKPASQTPLISVRGGLKVKKVSSLLSESALKDRFSPMVSTPVSILSSLPMEPVKLQTFPRVFPRTPLTGNTELEKKLLSENAELKAELDKNMDFILNQKAHYERLLSKETAVSDALQAKIKTLEKAKNDFSHAAYESQFQNQRATINNNDTLAQLKSLENEKRKLKNLVNEAYEELAKLQSANKELDEQLCQVTEESSRSNPFSAMNFIGEQFKDSLAVHLRREKKLKEKMKILTSQLEGEESQEGKDMQILHFASTCLNKLQLSWLEVLLKGEQADKEAREKFKELCLFLYESCHKKGYAACVKAFSLASESTVKAWLREELGGALSTAHTTMDVLFDDATLNELPKSPKLSAPGDEDDDLAENRKKTPKFSRDGDDDNEFNRSLKSARKRLKLDDDDSTEDGKASDEDEEIVFSEESEEEEGADDNDDDDEEEEEEEDEKKVSPNKGELKGVEEASPTVETQPEFELVLEEEVITQEEEKEKEGEDSAPIQEGTSMPLLVPDSPMTSIATLEETVAPRVTRSNTSEGKISNHKKGVASGSKVVFRMIES